MKKSSKNKTDQILEIDELEDLRAERNALIMHMVVEGMSYKEIGAAVGLHAASISKIALQNGFSKKPHLLLSSR